jgi:hypothetical protein
MDAVTDKARTLPVAWLLPVVLLMRGIASGTEVPVTKRPSGCPDGKAVAAAISSHQPGGPFEKLLKTEQGWETMLKCIGSGDSDWLGVVVALRGNLDGGSPSEVAMALGNALEHNPVAVLTLLKHGHATAGAVCGSKGGEDLLGTFEQALATVARRSRAVEAVREKSVVTQKRECLRELSDLKARVKESEAWFGH